LHEGTHLTGLVDEWATDCTALSEVWGAAWICLDVRQPLLMVLHYAAVANHLSKPPNYVRSGHC
jgi:hypothetical protein